MKNYTLNDLANALTEKGYATFTTSKQKNGIDIPCISVRFDNYGCIIYPQKDLDNVNNNAVDFNTIVSRYVEVIENAKLDKPIEVTALTDKEYLKANVFLAIERDFDAEYIKESLAEFPGLSKYMICRMSIANDSGYIRVTNTLIDSCGVDLDDVWEWAKENTFKNTTCQKISEILNLPWFDDFPMYVLSTKSQYKGASAILNKAVINDLAKRLGTNELIIIPSSINEVIAVPKKDDDDMALIANMIREINATEVSPEEVLFDKPFNYTVA